MRKFNFGKKFAAGAAALAMVATSSAASVASMTAFAGNLLGQGTFQEGAGLPWHICENGSASMAFEINNGVYAIEIINTGGASEGGEDRWDCQFRHRQLSITYGHKYRLTYSVYATNSGHMYAKLGDVTNDDCEYWHNCGNKVDMGEYDPSLGQDDLVSKLTSASVSKETDKSNQSQWDVPYYQGWNSWKEDTIPAKTWKTYAWEFYIDKSYMENLNGNVPEGKKTVEWTFHFGGDGQYTPEKCFPAGTVIKFDNLALIDMDGSDTDWEEPPVKEQRDIVLNQVGFYPNLQKQATVEGGSGSSFEVKDSSGKTVYTGTLGSAITDDTAGETVQIADFSDFTTPGTGYYIEANGKKSLPFDIGNDIYDGLVTDAMNYYYLNRSGIDLSDQYVSDSKGHYSNNPHDSDRTLGRKAGHKPDTAYISDEWVYIYTSEPTYSQSIDVTGGWYDAGDYGKYVVNGGVSMWTLGNTYERALYAGKADKWADGSGTVKIPETGNGIPDILDEMMWEADFFETMQRADGMVYHKIHDYKWTGLGVMPYYEEGTKEETTNPKRIVKPATYAATLNAAASWAQLARLLKPYNEAKANEYIAAAEKAYKAAKTAFVGNYKDIYAKVDGDYTKDDMFAPLEQNKGGGPYGDTQVSDEFYWASTELFLTTGGAEYGTDMRAYADAFTVPTHVFGGENKGDPTAFTWGTLEALGTMSYAVQKDNANADAAEIKKSSEAVQAAADYYLGVESKSGYGTNYEGQDMSATITVFDGDTPTEKTIDMKGAYGWGSNSMVANNAIVLGIAYDLTDEVKYLNGVSSSFDYILGRNAMENSYVTGWGTETTNYPHHRYWCPQMKAGWPYAPSGCLSGGPNSNMNDPMIQGAGYKIGELAPQKCYYDQNDAWSVNEITINWNAPLVWVSSFMEDEGPNAGEQQETKPTESQTGDILWGDADCNGVVNILDVITLNKSVMGKESLTDQGKINADVDQSGTPDSTDSLNILKLIVGLYTQANFPIK
ncbi:MAG: glycoside hydrolase family 9 protein [Oscillospiraceae bacterium]|nr:glycoside hydrolase family 9 protein [Oscillospiraceae bacterium]